MCHGDIKSDLGPKLSHGNGLGQQKRHSESILCDKDSVMTRVHNIHLEEEGEEEGMTPVTPGNQLRRRRSPSINESIMSDSNYDSGAFSRNSTPEPSARDNGWRNKSLAEVAPLISPPLVLSVSRSRHNHLPPTTGNRNNRPGLTRDDQPSPVTVTIGATTRLCINDLPTHNKSTQYQSLPNLHLVRQDTQSRMTPVRMTKMPHMGTSRLLTPPKPPRVRSVIISNPHSSLERPRNKISTSTVLLNRSNTSVGYFPLPDKQARHRSSRQFVPDDIQEETVMADTKTKLPSPLLRTLRDTSCGSDTSSGVFSVVDTGAGTNFDHKHTCKVTVNGQHLL